MDRKKYETIVDDVESVMSWDLCALVSSEEDETYIIRSQTSWEKIKKLLKKYVEPNLTK